MCMSKKIHAKRPPLPGGDVVSANECTGALQKISPDPEEIRRFHDEYIGE